MQILEALEMLDPATDAHWTSDGLPLVEVVAAVLGRPVKRGEITTAAPTFSRITAPTYFAPPADAPAAEEQPVDEEPPFAEDAEPESTAPVAPTAKAATPTAKPAAAPKDPATAKAPAVAPAGLSAPKPTETPSDSSEALAALLKLSPNEVLRSPETTASVFDAIERRIAELQVVKRDAEAEIKRLAGMSDVLSRLKERLHKADPNSSMEGIRSYLDRSASARAERAGAARRFIEAGTTARDVASAMNPAAPIDAAMARRTARGTQRPTPPPVAPG